ncbi:MAG: BtrH N-terminal domain-containing protein [Bacteroidales bacterium]|nr:BtrH N-terminal domain-containing protein [Bacteroidales bacterium]
MKIDFEHRMSAHCENGVISNLLRYYNIDLSEPMIFGIGSGIFFSYIPFLKLDGITAAAFRPLPGMVFRKAARSLGVTMKIKKYGNPDKAMDDLNTNLEKGIPTGMVVGVYHLPYFPPAYRFHFNAHNIIVFGRENGTYDVSDPVMETIETISYDDLKRVRYAQGMMKPKGKMYYVKSIPEKVDVEAAVIQGMKRTVKEMIKWPGPYIGVDGIKFLASRMRKWPVKYDKRTAIRNLGLVVRMQEEIGTGGAGFRFLYAAFLQEAAVKLQIPELNETANMMTATGDKWREFAVEAGRICKDRSKTNSYDDLADRLIDIAGSERKVYENMDLILKNR